MDHLPETLSGDSAPAAAKLVSYSGRTYEEGKKIGWRGGLRALWCIINYNFFRNP